MTEQIAAAVQTGPGIIILAAGLGLMVLLLILVIALMVITLSAQKARNVNSVPISQEGPPENFPADAKEEGGGSVIAAITAAIITYREQNASNDAEIPAGHNFRVVSFKKTGIRIRENAGAAAQIKRKIINFER